MGIGMLSAVMHPLIPHAPVGCALDPGESLNPLPPPLPRTRPWTTLLDVPPGARPWRGMSTNWQQTRCRAVSWQTSSAACWPGCSWARL